MTCFHCFMWTLLLTCTIYQAGEAVTGGTFGQGSGLTAVSQVQCSPANTELLQCYSSPLLPGACSTTDSAGVRCEGD